MFTFLSWQNGDIHQGLVYGFVFRQFLTLQWRHNAHDGVSNNRRHDCLFNRLFRHKSRKTPKLPVTGFLRGIHRSPANSPHKGPVTRIMFPFDDVIMETAKPAPHHPVRMQQPIRTPHIQSFSSVGARSPSDLCIKYIIHNPVFAQQWTFVVVVIIVVVGVYYYYHYYHYCCYCYYYYCYHYHYYYYYHIIIIIVIIIIIIDIK